MPGMPNVRTTVLTGGNMGNGHEHPKRPKIGMFTKGDLQLRISEYAGFLAPRGRRRGRGVVCEAN